jgi:hypothetical protein
VKTPGTVAVLNTKSLDFQAAFFPINSRHFSSNITWEQRGTARVKTDSKLSE